MNSRDKQSSADHGGSTSNIERNLKLGLLKAVCVPVTQPLHRIKCLQGSLLNSPTNPGVYNAFAVVRMLMQEKKISSFYKGCVPAMSKEFLKNAIYKGYLITNAPEYVDQVFAERLGGSLSPGQYTVFNAVAAGCFAGFGDTVAGGIPEFIATRRAASHAANANATLLGGIQFSKTPFKAIAALYTGFIPSVLKGSVNFSTLFYSSEPIKDYTRQLYGIQEGQQAPFVTNLTASFLTGFTVSVTASAFDNFKTSSQSLDPNSQSTLALWKDNVKKFGVRSLYVGLPMRLMVATIGWTASHFVLMSDRKPKANRVENEVKEQTISKKI